MPTLTQDAVLSALSAQPLPDAPGFTAADAIAGLEIDGASVSLSLDLGFPCNGGVEPLKQKLEQALTSAGAEQVSLAVEWHVPQILPANQQASVPGVKNIIAVASGKGGVGKSTVSVNLALALAAEGANVGILDADIYGPSQSHMLGLGGQRPEVKDNNTMLPLRALGVQCISMGNLVTDKTPMVWRGPMVSGALQQLLNNAEWSDVDYLIVDMPPGTGDIQLTLSQRVPVSGAVIVTTPQDIALLDAQKGIEMFRKVSIPVLGVVENMSLHTCTNCGHTEAIFGEQGGERLAEEYGVDLLGQLPLRADIREQTDQGKPPVAADPESDVSQLYRSIARQVGAALWRQSQSSGGGPEISVSDD